MMEALRENVVIHSSSGAGSPLASYLELMRLPNVFTAMADVAMGFLFVQPIMMSWTCKPWTPTPWDLATMAVLLVASSLLYVGGMVLNDVFDLEIDRRERPERPLPSGRIPVELARRLGYRLLLLGVAIATAAALLVGQFRPGVVALLLAIAILLYDSWLKYTPAGPIAMGACRTLNVMLGMNAADITLGAAHWLVAGGIGVYVAGITWFARKESQRSSRLHLGLATAVMVVGIAMIAWLPRWTDRILPRIAAQPGWWYLLLGGLAILIVRRCILAVIEPVPSRVRAAVTQCVLSIIMLDTVACYAVRGYWAVAIMALLLPALLLGRRMATT
jgi:4-hydroxybenzoate polyprenyltransferase